jgi:hypothetical protein
MAFGWPRAIDPSPHECPFGSLLVWKIQHNIKSTLYTLLVWRRSHYNSSRPSDSYYIDVVAACAFQQPVTILRFGNNYRPKDIPNRILQECSQDCFRAVTLQGETCKDFFERCVRRIPDCLVAASPSTSLGLPWPFCVLTAYGTMSSLAFKVNEIWPSRGCDIKNIIMGWLRNELIDTGDDDEQHELVDDIGAAILEPQSCRDLADFLRSRLDRSVGASAEQEEDDRAFVESKVAHVFFYGIYLRCQSDGVLIIY